MNTFGVIESKIKNSGRVTFEPLLVPNFIPHFRKILGAVLEICRDVRTYVRTYGRTHGTDFIGPFGFQPGPNNELG